MHGNAGNVVVDVENSILLHQAFQVLLAIMLIKIIVYHTCCILIWKTVVNKDQRVLTDYPQCLAVVQYQLVSVYYN